MQGNPVKILKDELVVDEEADDLFSVFVRGCTGDIRIETPYGKQQFRKNKTNKRIRKVKYTKKVKASGRA